jgi:cytochrome c556
MLTKKKRVLATSFLMLITANFANANNAEVSNTASDEIAKNIATEVSLSMVMQGLLIDTQQLTAAMVNEDFTLIAMKANNIAKHPKPSMATRMKIMKALGADMAKFKSNDIVVHNAAVDISKNAEQKNIMGVAENYKKMIGGCLSCHSAFKNRVGAILKNN